MLHVYATQLFSDSFLLFCFYKKSPFLSEYLQVVVASLATTGNTCNVNIGKATQTMAQWWGQPDKREMLYDMFK